MRKSKLTKYIIVSFIGLLLVSFWMLMAPIARFGICENKKNSNALEDGIFKIERDNFVSFYDGCMAAANGDAAAQYALGRYYLFLKGGIYKDSSKKNAVYWLKQATDNNHELAALDLGKLYYFGGITNKNYVLARKYLTIASKKYMKETAIFLANIYLNGKGVDVSYELAYIFLVYHLEWEIEKSKDVLIPTNIDPRAQSAWIIYETMLKRDISNDKELIKWLNIAAMFKHPFAMKIVSA